MLRKIRYGNHWNAGIWRIYCIACAGIPDHRGNPRRNSLIKKLKTMRGFALAGDEHIAFCKAPAVR